LLFLAVVACVASKEEADTTAALVPDTVKPAPAAAQLPPDVKAKTQATSASTKGSKVLGKDSVIRFDMGAPGRQLGRPDTTKRPKSSSDSTKRAGTALGRDSVIRFDMGAPGRQLGRPDTTKKKPPSQL
jgi:hypothetical protein